MNKNRFAPTPPMGWNSYDYYDTTVNEAQIKANADYMAANLKAYGWEYVVVDIEWYAHKAGSMRTQFQYIPFSELELDAYGRFYPDPERFPSSVDGAGFKPLADYVHSLGLKFGIHIMRGIPRAAAHAHLPILGTTYTANEAADPSSICGWNPDMYGLRKDHPGSAAYYDSIFALYAAWGVDFVKCDDICNTNLYKENPYSAAHEVELLHQAIEKSGRDIVLSLSPGPALIEKAWHYEKYANMWRITDDFWDNYELLVNMFDRCELWQNHVKPGCFPDCDMLPLGWIGKGFGQERQTNFTKDEQITMMTLWCIFRSPLMLGAELTRLDVWTLSLLTNRDVLDLLGEGNHGLQVKRDKNYGLPAGPLPWWMEKPKNGTAVWCSYREADRSVAVALFNLDDEEQEVAVSVEELRAVLPFAVGEVLPEVVTVKELWTGEHSVMEGHIFAKVAAHGARLYRIQ